MFNFTVTPDDGEAFHGKAGMRDVLQWEKTNRSKRVLSDLQNGFALADGYHIAWLACRRQGLVDASMTQDQFERTCEVSFDSEEEQDPTQPEASTGA
jgi:hypothetical protein